MIYSKHDWHANEIISVATVIPADWCCENTLASPAPRAHTPFRACLHRMGFAEITSVSYISTRQL